MSIQGDDWDDLRGHWQRLERNPLSAEQVFDDPARSRIGTSIAAKGTDYERRPRRHEFEDIVEREYSRQPIAFVEHGDAADPNESHVGKAYFAEQNAERPCREELDLASVPQHCEVALKLP